MTEHATVYVPKPGTYAFDSIREGSGVVGKPADNGRLQVDYEGAIYGQVNLSLFVERVYHAYARQWSMYPTVARMWPPADDLVPVGVFDADRKMVLLSGQAERELLADWLGVPDVSPVELGAMKEVPK